MIVASNLDEPPRWRGLVNWLNLSTPAGLALARVGAQTTRPGREGLWLAFGYRLPIPKAPAFTLGSVILLRRAAPDPEVDAWTSVSARLLAHESRHATQYAYFGGILMPAAYLVAAGWSWIRTGDWAWQNYFERAAGLADGGYREPPERPERPERPVAPA